MRRLVYFCSILFGYLLIGLSLIVVIETFGRKLIGFSLQGADELGGYVLAVGSTLAFTVALIERAHIRIDILRGLPPRVVLAVTDWLSVVLLFCFSALLAWVCLQVLRETIEYGSVAPSPWGTPLVYPQALWVLAMVLFFLLAFWFAVDATLLLLNKRFTELIQKYGAKDHEEELVEELVDLSRR